MIELIEAKKTDAEKHVIKYCGRKYDGDCFDWLEDPDNPGKKRRDAPRSELDGTLSRYEFRDGSMIVVTDIGWDFGVHTTRLEAWDEGDPRMAHIDDGTDYEDLLYAQVRSGEYGVEDDDQYPLK